MDETVLDYTVPMEWDGERIDLFLSEQLGVSRGRVHKAITGGSVSVNGSNVRKSYALREGDYLHAEIAPEAELKAVETPYDLPIVYSDDDLLVVDKPVGMAAHAARGWSGPTVLGALLAAGWSIDTEGDEYRRGIVHRLDAATTGLMVVARTNQAFNYLKRAFQDRQVTKIYHALVQGHMPHQKGTIDAPIARSKSKDFRMAVRADGKPAITHYTIIESHRETDLIEVSLETGRTHQIRVHCAALQRPCIGDQQYGANPRLSKAVGAQRQWLHASVLSFIHPVTGESMKFSSEYPADLLQVLEKARTLGAPTRALKSKPNVN